MKVALLSRAAHPLHPPGGLERAVYDLARHLEARGVRTLLFTRPATQEGAFPGEVRYVPYGPKHSRSHGRVWDRVVYYPRFALQLGQEVARLVRQGEVDLVHAQGLTALGYGRLRRAEKSLRAPLVMNPQGMEEHKSIGFKRLALTRIRALSREAAQLADRVIATDEATREEVPRLLGVDPLRVVVLENAVDVDGLRRATPSDPKAVIRGSFSALSGAFPLLLSVGRVEAYKGFADVLGALKILEARRGLPARWAWALVGEGTFRPDLEKFLRSTGRRSTPAAHDASDFAAHVHVLGRVSEEQLHALYERADVFVHATRYEGSSLVTLEAMAHGRAVVATRAGGIPDKIEDGATGRLVEPGDAAGLAAALETLVGDAALRGALGQRARDRVEARFSWATVAEKTIRLYEELLRGARA